MEKNKVSIKYIQLEDNDQKLESAFNLLFEEFYKPKLPESEAKGHHKVN